MTLNPVSLPIHLETERLIIRPFSDHDLQPFWEYRNDPQVARYQGWEFPYSHEQATQFIAEMKQAQLGIVGQWYQLALEEKHSQTLIGDCAFMIRDKDKPQARIGITLARAFQGRGYACEAVTRVLHYLFDDLQVHRVSADCDPLNTASIHLLERLGLRREAHFIHSLWFRGEWVDEYWYAILRDEWLERQVGA